MSLPRSVGKPMGDAILHLLLPLKTTLGLVRLGWLRNMSDPVTSYPTNPYRQCPRMLLRYYTAEFMPGPPRGGTVQGTNYTYSIIYQRRQTPGEEHQELLVNESELIANFFSENSWQPYLLQAVPGYDLISAVPQITYHPELRHEFDDPNLRISVCEVVIKVEGRISVCQ
jgi:hypothetical protein